MMNSLGDDHEGKPLVVATDLVVTRSKNEILHGISFSLPRGSITGLLGPSGCGKTTLMRTIVGVQRIAGGSLTVAGKSAGSASLRSRIGYTSQGLSIYPDVSVRANVSYFARLQGADMAQVDEVIETVGLSQYAGQRVNTLSGGQAGRASLACALVGSPELLVLDEPTVGLDPLTRESLWEAFHTLAERGITLLISSHVLDEATRCDSVLFMRDGQILAHEPISALQSRTNTHDPESAFLALVKGSMHKAGEQE